MESNRIEGIEGELMESKGIEGIEGIERIILCTLECSRITLVLQVA
jgi:hypothetical protein